MSNGASTPSAFKRAFVGDDAGYATKVPADDLLHVAGPYGPIFRVTSTADADYVSFSSHGYTDVRALGAVGDGVTIDTTAIQQALSAVGDDGGTVVIPAGTFVYNAPLEIKSGTTLIGPGTLKAAPDADWPGASRRALINVNNLATGKTDTNITIRGLTLDHTGIDGHCIYIRMATHVVIKECTIIGGASSVALLACDDTLEEGNTYLNFSNCGSDHWDAPSNARVVGCHIETTNSSQMLNWNPENTAEEENGNVADGLTFTGNVLISHEVSGTACQVEPLEATNIVKNVTITGNIFKNCYLAMRGDVRGAIVTGNTFSDFQGNVAAVLCTDQFAAPPTGVIISGNTIRDSLAASPNTGVIVLESNNGEISGNTITGTAYTVAAIYTQTYSPNIYGNSIEKASFPGYMQGGFRLLNGDTHYIGWLDTTGGSSRMHIDASDVWKFFVRDASAGQRTVFQINARSSTSSLKCGVPLGMEDLFYLEEANGLTATGSSSGGALLLAAQINQVATVAASAGVRLMNISFYGLAITVVNDGANALNVYPTTGGAIDSLGTNVAVSVPAGSVGEWVAVGSGKWRTKNIYP